MHGNQRWWVCGGLYKRKMFYSGQSLSNGKDQSLSAKVREFWHNIPE